jgi:hypothetical protein
MDQLMGFGFENKHNKKSLKIYPDTFGLLNVIKQLQHLILCNMMCYGALKSNTECGLRPWSILHFSAP